MLKYLWVIGSPRRLSENRSRNEGKLVWVRFFHYLTRIVVLFKENNGKIWPNPAFPHAYRDVGGRAMQEQLPSRLLVLGQPPSPTLRTTNAFLVPISIEWSMIAIQDWFTGLTCLSSPSPKRNVQLMTDVKWGVQFNLSAVSMLNNSRIRGTLR